MNKKANKKIRLISPRNFNNYINNTNCLKSSYTTHSTWTNINYAYAHESYMRKKRFKTIRKNNVKIYTRLNNTPDDKNCYFLKKGGDVPCMGTGKLLSVCAVL